MSQHSNTDQPSPHFILDDSLIYVNHAAVSPWPLKTAETVKHFADENARLGSRHYQRWLQTEQELRDRLATLIHARSSDEIALLKNTSEGLSVIAYGLSWQAGDNIIISNEEFPSNFIVWNSLADQGVRLIQVDISGDNPEQALIEQMDEHTKLLSISAVQYASGRRLDLIKLGRACREHNILFCVDAIQQIGALEFDVEAMQADFVVADGHKWMLGPEGLALFYCRRKRIPQLQLKQFGWHMVEDVSRFDAMENWQPASSARRFECGSPNMLAIHALHSSIGLLLELGMEHIEACVLERVQYLIQRFSDMDDIEILSPTQSHQHAGIFTFYKQQVDQQKLYDTLVASGVVCALRGGGIRFSPHFYTPFEQLDTLADRVRQYKGS